MRAATPFAVFALAGKVGLTGVNVTLVLEVDEEEQLVSNDRTSNAHADGVIQRFGEIQTVGIVAEFVFKTELGTDETVAGEVVIHADMPVVGTALGDSIDGTASEAAVTHIERSDVDGHGLKSVQGDGATASRQVAANTEGVVEGCTVNGDIRRTVVTTADGEVATKH